MIVTPFNRVRSKTPNYRFSFVKTTTVDNVTSSPVTFSADYLGFNQIYDIVPVGSYKPGRFKITDVRQRQRVWNVQPSFTSHTGMVNAYYAAVYPSVAWKWRADLQGSLFWNAHATQLELANPTWSDNFCRSMLTKALAKANESTVGAGESLAEAGQCLRMVARPLAGLSSILRNVMLKRNGKLRTLKDASSAWLEYRYGWTPLYLTAKAAWEFSGYEAGMDNVAFRFVEVNSLTSVREKIYSSTFGISSISNREVEEKKAWVSRVFFNVFDPKLLNAIRYGGSVFNVPALLWELVPFSFVVDWWLDVGSFIKAMTPNPAISVMGATLSCSHFREQRRHHTYLCHGNGSDSPSWYYQKEDTVSSLTDRVYERWVLPASMHPSLPNLDLGFNSMKHAVDALGLIVQRAPAHFFKR